MSLVCFPFSWVNTNLCRRPIFVFTYRITQAVAHYARVSMCPCVCVCVGTIVTGHRPSMCVSASMSLGGPALFLSRIGAREIEIYNREGAAVEDVERCRGICICRLFSFSLFRPVPQCACVCVRVVSGFLEVAAIVSVPDAYAYLCFLWLPRCPSPPSLPLPLPLAATFALALTYLTCFHN